MRKFCIFVAGMALGAYVYHSRLCAEMLKLELKRNEKETENEATE